MEMSEEFPEFRNAFPSVVLWIEFFTTEDGGTRLTAVGCECGALYLFVVDLREQSLVHSCEVTHGNSITSCRFFAQNGGVNLLVTNSLLPAMLYKYVFYY